MKEESPLISASRHGNLKIVRFLLTLKDIDISIKDNNGKSFLDYLQSKGKGMMEIYNMHHSNSK